MAKYQVIFTRDVIQIGSLLVEAENSVAALAEAGKLGPHDIARDAIWVDDTAGAPYPIAASDEPKEKASG